VAAVVADVIAKQTGTDAEADLFHTGHPFI